MRGALNRLAKMATDGVLDAAALPWHELRHAHVSALRSALVERYSTPSTVNLHLAALRGCLKAAWRLGLMTGEECQKACDVASVRGSRLPAGRALSAGELRALFQACADDTSPAGSRDSALIALLYSTGLRRSEAAGLELADYNETTGAIRVLGKGNKERTVHVVGGAAVAMSRWLDLRGREAGALFLPVSKGAEIGTGGITAQAIYNALC